MIDMDDKGATSGIRVSPHYYNTPDEVGALIDATREILCD